MYSMLFYLLTLLYTLNYVKDAQNTKIAAILKKMNALKDLCFLNIYIW